jgi:hypothetical protein
VTTLLDSCHTLLSFNNLYSNPKIYTAVSEKYQDTTIVSGNIRFLIDALGNYDEPFAPIILDRIVESFTTTSTIGIVIGHLHSVGNFLGELFGSEYRDEFFEIIGKVTDLSYEPTVSDPQYLPEDQVDSYLESIEDPIGKVLHFLALKGLTTNCLVRVVDLSKLKDGVAVVGNRLNVRNTAPREVHFDAKEFNFLDPSGELVKTITEIKQLVSKRNAGLVGKALSAYCSGTGYTTADLRNSQVLHLRNRQISDDDIAKIQGVKKSWLRKRVRTFIKLTGAS